jgi:predicted nucleotidyltransferase
MDRRHELIAAAGRYDITDLRLFGSVARGDERPDSDVDLLATLPPSLTLWSLAAAEEDLGEIVQAKIDLVPLADLKPGVREQVLAEAVPL